MGFPNGLSAKSRAISGVEGIGWREEGPDGTSLATDPLLERSGMSLESSSSSNKLSNSFSRDTNTEEAGSDGAWGGGWGIKLSIADIVGACNGTWELSVGRGGRDIFGSMTAGLTRVLSWSGPWSLLSRRCARLNVGIVREGISIARGLHPKPGAAFSIPVWSCRWFLILCFLLSGLGLSFPGRLSISLLSMVFSLMSSWSFLCSSPNRLMSDMQVLIWKDKLFFNLFADVSSTTFHWKFSY